MNQSSIAHQPCCVSTFLRLPPPPAQLESKHLTRLSDSSPSTSRLLVAGISRLLPADDGKSSTKCLFAIQSTRINNDFPVGKREMILFTWRRLWRASICTSITFSRLIMTCGFRRKYKKKNWQNDFSRICDIKMGWYWFRARERWLGHKKII